MDWPEIIRDYNLNHRPGNKDQLAWFRGQPSLEDALLKAAKAEDERGKRYRHQNNVWRTAIPEAQHRLLHAADQLQECKSFHELWLLLYMLLKPVDGSTNPVKGLGHLYIYDTALRLGSYLGFAPEKIYLHAGTLEGAKKFGFISGSKAWLELDDLPEDLQNLPANEVEDILCIYKDMNVRAGGCVRRKKFQC
jgi:hypothetical protein